MQASCRASRNGRTGPVDTIASNRQSPRFTAVIKSGIGRETRLAHWKATALHPLFEVVGTVAAVITTFAWLPQILKILRERQARDISLATTATLASGVFLWVVYGVAIGSMPVILANAVSFLFIAAIVALKLRFR